MSTLRLTTISNQSGSSSVPSDTVINGSAKAWVNFNGTGTVAIRASFNVSSITDRGTGQYTVNFTTAMPDANYSVNGACGRETVGYEFLAIEGASNMSTSSVQIATRVINQSALDEAVVTVSVFR